MASRVLCLTISISIAACLSPVVIVPGDGSNQLEAKLDKPSVPHFYCSKTADWYRLWLNLEILLPGVIDCWCDNIALDVNSTTGRAVNRPGVETRVPAFGSTEALEELDPTVGSKSAAFLNMVNTLVGKGYEKNKTLRGAPYDFRYTPDSDIGYGIALKTLIEQTVNETGKPVVLISHSMGGLQTLYFLNGQTAEWKQRFILHWVAISAPFGGAAKEFGLFASGNAEGLPVNPLTIRGEQRSYETNHWLMPVKSVWGDTVLVTTAEKNYTAQDTDQFFEDIAYPVGKLVLPRVQSLIIDPTHGPGVPVSCLYSKSVKTPLAFNYTGLSFDDQPMQTDGDGDGTVNLLSLQVCDLWNATQSEPVTSMVFEGISHSDMISNSTAIQAVVAIIQALG